MIDIKNLVKQFGPFTAVDNISLSVARGEVLGFLGPNGAGKSTTMKMLCGFLAPTSGSIAVCGHDVETDPLAAKRSIGYLPEGAPAYADMTARGFLDSIADIRGLSGVRKSGVDGKSVSVRVDPGGLRCLTKKHSTKKDGHCLAYNK